MGAADGGRCPESAPGQRSQVVSKKNLSIDVQDMHPVENRISVEPRLTTHSSWTPRRSPATTSSDAHRILKSTSVARSVAISTPSPHTEANASGSHSTTAKTAASAWPPPIITRNLSRASRTSQLSDHGASVGDHKATVDCLCTYPLVLATTRRKSRSTRQR